MSRSVHTQPRRLRAARRARDPRAPRSEADLRDRRALARELKRRGLVPGSAGGPAEPSSPASRPAPLPRLRFRSEGSRRRQVLRRRDIVALLRFLGESATYGLAEIELRPGPPCVGPTLVLGKLASQGRIELYAPPPSPWRLPGRLSRRERRELERAGAVVEPSAGGAHTLVTWPGDTLREYLLFEVLCHEIGHHILQHERRERRRPSARTRDHEAFAETVDVESEDWARLGRDVTFVRLEVPAERYAYRYRFPATIALAEAARQIGRRAPGAPGRPPRHEPPWESALRVLLETEAQRVGLEELSEY